MNEDVFRWREDDFTPRVDVLSEDLTAEANVLPVAHPEWFRPGDVVRVGEDDLYDSGERDEFNKPIFRARNEAVVVGDQNMLIWRARGVNPAQAKNKGERVTIIGTAF